MIPLVPVVLTKVRGLLESYILDRYGIRRNRRETKMRADANQSVHFYHRVSS